MIRKVRLWKARMFLVLTVMTVFITCQKDDDDDGSSLQLQETQGLNLTPKTIMTTVSADEIPDVMSYLLEKGDKQEQFRIVRSDKGTTRSSEPDLVIGELQTDEILKITDQNNKSNYTFLLTSIENVDETVESFFNLIVKESSNELFSYITEYRPDANWVPNYRDTQDFSTFSGEILHYNINGRYIAKLTLNNGIILNGETRDACPPDGDSNNDTGNNGGNDGNTDGDTGDGSPGDGNPGGEDNTPGPDVEAALMWLCNHRNQLHNTPSECNNPGAGGTWVIVITYGDKSVEDTLRCPDIPDVPVECHQPNTELCPYGCNEAQNGCADAPTEEEEPDTTNPTIPVFVDVGLGRDCRKLENLANSPSFQQRMEELIGNNNGNTEIGYYGRIDNNENTSYADDDRFESDPDDLGINPNSPDSPINSFIHNHFNTTDVNGNIFRALPVFSGSDLYTIFNLYNNGLITDLDSFVIVVTTPGLTNSPDDDTVYAVTISNPNDFMSIAGNLGIIPNLIDQDIALYGINRNISSELNEQSLAELFKQRGYGMTLYKGDTNLTDWTRIKIKNNGDKIETNCN